MVAEAGDPAGKTHYRPLRFSETGSFLLGVHGKLDFLLGKTTGGGWEENQAILRENAEAGRGEVIGFETGRVRSEPSCATSVRAWLPHSRPGALEPGW